MLSSFCIRCDESKHLKGQLGPRVRHVTFFGSKKVSWGPASVTSHFWIKEGQLGPCVCHVTFLDQRRSVGASHLSRNVFGSKEGSWGPASVT